MRKDETESQRLLQGDSEKHVRALESSGGKEGGTVASEGLLRYGKLIGNLVVPIFLSSSLSYGQILIELHYVGLFGSDDLAALSLGVSWLNLVCYCLFWGVCSGFDTLACIQFGSNRLDLVRMSLARAVAVTAVMLVPVCVLSVWCEDMFRLCRQPAELSRMAAVVVWMRMPGVPFRCFYELLVCFFRAQSVVTPVTLVCGLTWLLQLFLCSTLYHTREQHGLGSFCIVGATSVSCIFSAGALTLYWLFMRGRGGSEPPPALVLAERNASASSSASASGFLRGRGNVQSLQRDALSPDPTVGNLVAPVSLPALESAPSPLPPSTPSDDDPVGATGGTDGVPGRGGQFPIVPPQKAGVLYSPRVGTSMVPSVPPEVARQISDQSERLHIEQTRARRLSRAQTGGGGREGLQVRTGAPPRWAEEEEEKGGPLSPSAEAATAAATRILHWPALKELLGLAGNCALWYVLETWAWDCGPFLIGFGEEGEGVDLGVTLPEIEGVDLELEGGHHGAAADISAFEIGMSVFMTLQLLPLAIPNAACTLTGNLFGAGRPAEAQRAAMECVVVQQTVQVAILVFAWFSRERFFGFFTHDPEVLPSLRTVFPLILGGSFFDGTAQVFGGILRGAGRPELGAWCTLVAYWVVGIPLALILLFVFQWLVLGMWAGLASGCLTLFSLMAFALLRLDWETTAREAMKGESPTIQSTQRAVSAPVGGSASIGASPDLEDEGPGRRQTSPPKAAPTSDPPSTEFDRPSEREEITAASREKGRTERLFSVREAEERRDSGGKSDLGSFKMEGLSFPDSDPHGEHETS